VQTHLQGEFQNYKLAGLWWSWGAVRICMPTLTLIKPCWEAITWEEVMSCDQSDVIQLFNPLSGGHSATFIMATRLGPRKLPLTFCLYHGASCKGSGASGTGHFSSHLVPFCWGWTSCGTWVAHTSATPPVSSGRPRFLLVSLLAQGFPCLWWGRQGEGGLGELGRGPPGEIDYAQAQSWTSVSLARKVYDSKRW